jgi:hypothetical protein
LIEELQDHIYLRNNNSIEAFSSTSSTLTSSNSKPTEKEFKSLTSVPSSCSSFELDDLTNEDLNELRVSISRRTYLTPVPSSTTSAPGSLSSSSSNSFTLSSSSSTGAGGVGQGLDQEVKKKQASKEAMLTLIQSLKVLGQVSSAISTLTSQLQQEIHVVVDKVSSSLLLLFLFLLLLLR